MQLKKKARARHAFARAACAKLTLRRECFEFEARACFNILLNSLVFIYVAITLNMRWKEILRPFKKPVARNGFCVGTF